MNPNCRRFVLLLVPAVLAAQGSADLQPDALQQILDRLERLERENRNLAAEVRELRDQLAPRPAAPQASAAQTAPSPPLEERVAVNERRIEEQAQTKVEASQKFPLALTGMVLFNGFLNGRASGGLENPTTASFSPGAPVGGGTLAQSVVGLKYQGPRVGGGGQVSGALYMDFFGGSSSSLNHLLRMRTATVEIAWKNTSIMAGQDKPIISPREPNSLAQVGVSPLTGAGNPWLWQPQARIEQRFVFGEQMGLRSQVGVYQTSEPAYQARGGNEPNLTVPARPGLEGRFEFWRRMGAGARVEIAPGFHISETHADGVSSPSQLFSLDWLIQPLPKIQLTGMFFEGQNAAGLGALRQGFTVFSGTRIVPVQVAGGWSQVSYLATKRLSFNIYGGQESDRKTDLLSGDIHRNLAYAGNLIYRLGPNVLVGLEASQVRTDFVRLPRRLNNHYDLALAYLF